MLKYNFSFLGNRGGGSVGRIDTNKLAGPAFFFKLYDPVDQREQSIVLAAAYVFPGFPARASLARKDVTAQYALAAKFLQTEPLRIRVSTVPRRTYPFFMSHNAFCDLRFSIAG